MLDRFPTHTMVIDPVDQIGVDQIAVGPSDAVNA